MENKKIFINPIDEDHITEIPNIIQYPHHRGSSLIKPEDMGKVKSRAYTAMEQQTQAQLQQIYDQIEILAKQAKKIKQRIEVSTLIYNAEMKFEPLIGKIYHLYQKQDEYLLSLVSPTDWGRSQTSLVFLATVKLLSDHTWEILEKSEHFTI